MRTQTILSGLRAMPDAATIPLLAALNEASDGNMEAVPGLLETAAQNMRLE